MSSAKAAARYVERGWPRTCSGGRSCQERAAVITHQIVPFSVARNETPRTRTANPKTGPMASPSRSPAWGARLDAIRGAAPSGVPRRTSPP